MQPCIDNAIKVAQWIAAARPSCQIGTSGPMIMSSLTRAFGMDYDKLGNGCFSNVFTMPKAFGEDHVIKLCTSESEVGFVYLAWAQRHWQEHKHIPVVHHIERMFSANGKPAGYVAVLNRLRPLSQAGQNKFYKILDGRECRDESDFSKHEREEGLAQDSLWQEAHKVYSMFRGVTGWDLHSSNVMQDTSDTIIITDPITGLTDTTPGGKPATLLTGMMRSLGLPEAA